jgi:hypothetical protein
MGEESSLVSGRCKSVSAPVHWLVLSVVLLLARYVWIITEPRHLLLESDGARINAVTYTLLREIWHCTMPDGSHIDVTRWHWYLGVIILGAGLSSAKLLYRYVR